MGHFNSFAEILENKLRKELENAIRSELRTETKEEQPSPMSFQPDVISLLLGRVSPVKASNLTKASLYHQHRPKVRPQAPPKPAHKLTAEQDRAFQQFAAWGLGLADNFSSKDLKTAFRKRLRYNNVFGFYIECTGCWAMRASMAFKAFVVQITIGIGIRESRQSHAAGKNLASDTASFWSLC